MTPIGVLGPPGGHFGDFFGVILGGHLGGHLEVISEIMLEAILEALLVHVWCPLLLRVLVVLSGLFLSSL